ncbi:MAG TPA: non-ribosomal peptide synthetase [Candidatus Acidoferrales bacterium]|nr:non-ribosomal peptide synthetase [Candidatus Acidoferrales bacterium]
MSSPLSNSHALGAAAARSAPLPDQIRRWNETATEYPRDKTVAQVFEAIAADQSEAIALEMGAQRVRYGELNARANRLARELRERGAGAEHVVGCYFERSIEMIVAFLAVLKSGAAFVPLDPGDPAERVDFLLRDARLDLVLSQERLCSRFGARSGFLSIEQMEASGLGRESSNLPRVSGPTSLAYAMYTSGTTGKPKGVMVENRAIVRLVCNTNYCRFGRDEVFLQFAPASFDASTFEIWGPLLNGAKLVVMPPGAVSLADLGREIRESGVTTLWLTSGLFNLMVEQRLEDLRGVRQLLAGGDVLSPRHVRIALENLPDCRLINGYGPTENTTFTCCYTVERNRRVGEAIPIGRPVANTQVYILDEEMTPLPPGQAGELYAAGDGVARGYFNDPHATAEKFLTNPFSTGPAERMYRTGDLARWRDDGVVEFLGRVDHQVKISGHRVEPAEIETVLRMNEGVSEVCVLPDAAENGHKRLIAYYVPASNDERSSSSDLRRYLTGKLPHYMIPASFVQLSAMPLSPNGKVDCSALAGRAANLESAAAPTSDATELERNLVELWKRILRVETVGLDENFFDAGGDSLMIIALHANLQKTLAIEIEITDLFQFTTIRALARFLTERSRAANYLSDAQQQAEKQREAFARRKRARAGGRA